MSIVLALKATLKKKSGVCFCGSAWNAISTTWLPGQHTQVLGNRGQRSMWPTQREAGKSKKMSSILDKGKTLLYLKQEISQSDLHFQNIHWVIVKLVNYYGVWEGELVDFCNCMRDDHSNTKRSEEEEKVNIF